MENIPNDTHVLQSDLFRLTEWSKTWLLKFNPDKFETMRMTHKQDKSKDIKDLGITILYDLSWSSHIHEVVNKANKVLGVVKRVLESNSVNGVNSLCYTNL